MINFSGKEAFGFLISIYFYVHYIIYTCMKNINKKEDISIYIHESK